MLLPQELKQHNFSRSFRGYAADEVDEYIAFVVSKYEALYRENDETGRKLALAVESLEELRAREAKIAALEAAIRKAAEQILAEAEQKRRQILADAEEYAARIVAEADAHVASQENQFLQIQKEVAAFRDTLFAAYSTHIDKLEELSAIAAEEAFTDPVPAVTLAEAAEEIAPAFEEEADEAPAEDMDDAAPVEDVPEESTPADEDVYTEEELLDEPEEIAEDDSDKYEMLPAEADEDVYTEKELADTDPFPAEEPAEDEPETAADEDTEEAAVEPEEDAESDLFASLFTEELSDAEDTEEPEAEEVPWPEDTADSEEAEEVPADTAADESDDDALLRELHEVFAREFAAIKNPGKEAAAPADTGDDDENLSELKKRMGIADEPKEAKPNDFAFLPEDAGEEAPQKHGLFGKNN